ncbi:NAD-dependent epimerase/dehydratase [Spirillospora sp. NPDC052269]
MFQRSGSAAAADGRPVVAVLGASGFIGSAVLRALAEHPVLLRAVARRPTARPLALPAVFEPITADLTDCCALTRAVDGADVIIYLLMDEGGWRSAESDPAAERVNVGVMRNLVEILRATTAEQPPPTVLYAGSAGQVGPRSGSRIDGSEPDRPVLAYDRQKLAAETLLRDATREGVARGVSIRLPTVFGHGPVADRGVVATMARLALRGEPLPLWDVGAVTRDLLYLPDVAAAFTAALDRVDTLAGRHWLISSGHDRPLGDVFAAIAEAVARHTGEPPVPVVPVARPGHATSGDSDSVSIDDSAFRAATGWRPRVSFRTALDRTVLALLNEPHRP